MKYVHTIIPIGCAALTVFTLATSTSCREATAKVKGAGDNLQAFIIQNAETGDRYCQVCAFGGKPTIMAVGDLNDPKFENDLKKIQGLFEKNKEKGLTAFAVFGTFNGKQFGSPPEPQKAMEKVKRIQAKLGLNFPVTITPKTLTEKEKKNYAPFTKLYDVSESRTVMVGGADNKIVFAEVLGEGQYKAFESAVQKVL